MKKLLMIACFLLNGCAVVQTHHVKLWILCYQDDTILANGMYQNNQLQMRCNKRSQVQFQYKFGNTDNTNWSDGFQKYMKEHKGD